MASVDIFQQYLQPVRSVQDYAADMDKAEANQLALQGQRRQNEIAALTTDQTRQTMASSAEDRNALQRLAATWGADTSIDQRVASLRNSGRPALMQQADALEKQGIEKQKTGAEVSAKNADAIASAIKNSRTWLDGISTPEQYIAWHEANHRDPALGPYLESRGITADQARARIAQALSQPGGFAKMLNESKLGAEKAYDNLLKEAQQAEAARHNKVVEGLTRRGQDITIRGQDLTDNRQRDLNAITKDDKAEQRKREAEEKAVTKFSDTLQKEGIPEIENAVAGAESALNRYPKGKVPGVGPVKNALPAMMMSDEGKDVRQALAQVRNIVLSARSGAAVTDQELRRLVEEVGTGAGMTEADARKGLSKIRARLDVIKGNAAAGVSDDVLRTYKDRGGLDIRRGSQTQPQPQGGPKVGAVEDGHRFKGGNPADPANWEKVK